MRNLTPLLFLVAIIVTYITTIVIVAILRKSGPGTFKLGTTKEGRTKRSELIIQWGSQPNKERRKEKSKTAN